jgi:hypothetical protein
MIMMMIVIVMMVAMAAVVTTTMILGLQGIHEGSHDDTMDADLMPTGWPQSARPILHKKS